MWNPLESPVFRGIGVGVDPPIPPMKLELWLFKNQFQRIRIGVWNCELTPILFQWLVRMMFAWIGGSLKCPIQLLQVEGSKCFPGFLFLLLGLWFWIESVDRMVRWFAHWGWSFSFTTQEQFSIDLTLGCDRQVHFSLRQGLLGRRQWMSNVWNYKVNIQWKCDWWVV